MDIIAISLHGTHRTDFYELSSPFVYIGIVSPESFNSPHFIKEKQQDWRNYLHDKGADDAQLAKLIVLPIGTDDEIQSLLTIKKRNRKRYCLPGIENHNRLKARVYINGVIQNDNNYSLLSDSDTVAIETADLPHRIHMIFNLRVFDLHLSAEENYLEVDYTNIEAESHRNELPFDEDQLFAIYQGLNFIRENKSANVINAPKLAKRSRERLEELGFWEGSNISSSLHSRLGRQLYDLLFSESVKKNIQIITSKLGRKIIIRLHIKSNDVVLFQYPWELIADETNMSLTVSHGGVDLFRIIKDTYSVDGRNRKLPLKMLFINPNPRGDLGGESEYIRTALKKLEEQGIISFVEVTPPTWKNFLDEVVNPVPFDILHFDGHSSYGRVCNNCEAKNNYFVERCQRCGASLKTSVTKGYLNFEGSGSNKEDKVPIEEIKTSLSKRGIALAVFTSCDSAQVGGHENTFNSLAPGLIQIGIPSVVGMQGKVLSSSMQIFTEVFYKAIAQSDCLPDAIRKGRQYLLRDNYLRSWFVPVLYVASSHSNDCVFRIDNDTAT